MARKCLGIFMSLVLLIMVIPVNTEAAEAPSVGLYVVNKPSESFYVSGPKGATKVTMSLVRMNGTNFDTLIAAIETSREGDMTVRGRIRFLSADGTMETVRYGSTTSLTGDYATSTVQADTPNATEAFGSFTFTTGEGNYGGLQPSPYELLYGFE